MTRMKLSAAIAAATLCVFLSGSAAQAGIVNGNFSSTSLTNGTADYSDKDAGWFSKNAYDGTAPDNWRIQPAGHMEMLSNSGTKTRYGQGFSAGDMTGTGWSLEFDLGGAFSNVERVEVWAGKEVASPPSGAAIINIGADGGPAGSIVQGGSWVKLVDEATLTAAHHTYPLAGDPDLTDYDIMAIRFRARSAGVGAQYDNVEFTQAGGGPPPTTGQTTGVLDLSGRDSTGLGAGESGSNMANPKTFSATTDFSLDDIAWGSGGLSGTFDLSFVATGSAGNIRRGGKGAWGTGGNALLSGVGESVALGALVASDLTGDLLGITNLQYNAIYLGNGGAGETALINGVSGTSAGGGDTTAAMRNDITLATTVTVVREAGSISMNGIDVTFDAQVVGGPPAPISILGANFDGSPLRAAGAAISAADLDAGTVGGTWTVGDDQESVIGPEAGDSTNHALAGDRGPYSFDLALTGPPLTLATDEVVVSFDSQIVRTSNNPNEKKNFVTGWDSLGAEVFQIVLTTDGTDGGSNPQGRLKYVNQSGSEVLLANSLESVGGNPVTFAVADMSNLRIEMGATTMDIFVNGTLLADDVAYRTLGVTDFAGFTFAGSGGGDSNAAGAWYDNIGVIALPATPIPEPATMCALGLAVCGLGRYVRKRRRA